MWVTVTDPQEALLEPPTPAWTHSSSKGSRQAGTAAPSTMPTLTRTTAYSPAQPDRRPGRPSPDRCRRHRHRPRPRRCPRRRRLSRGARHRLPPLPRSRHQRRPPRRSHPAATHRPDTRLLRPPRPRTGQHLPSRPHRRRADRLPRAAPPHHPATRPRPHPRRRRTDQPLGRPSPRAGQGCTSRTTGERPDARCHHGTGTTHKAASRRYRYSVISSPVTEGPVREVSQW